MEHGVYTLLLDRYYVTEAGIPADHAHRLARARSPEERAAVDAVLAEFFVLTDGVYKNLRAEEEIAAAHVRIATAQRNGRNGGRPRKNTETEPEAIPEETQQKPSGFLLGTPTHNPELTQSKALQSPDTSKSKREPHKRGSRRAPDDFAPDLDWAQSEVMDMDVEAEAAKFRDCEFKTAKTDWPATWRNWVRNAKADGRYAKYRAKPASIFPPGTVFDR